MGFLGTRIILKMGNKKTDLRGIAEISSQLKFIKLIMSGQLLCHLTIIEPAIALATKLFGPEDLR